VGAALSCACALAACRSPRQEIAERQPLIRGVPPTPPPSPSDTRLFAPTTVNVAPPPAANPGPSRDVDDFAADMAAAEVAAQSGTEKPPRDFPSELLKMLGDPATCLAPRAADNPRRALTISVETRIMSSGAVARSEVQAPELSAPEKRCLVGRVEALRFPGPIPDPPLTVRASITLQPKPGSAAPPQPSAAVVDPTLPVERPIMLEPDPDAPQPAAAAPLERPSMMQPDPEPPQPPAAAPVDRPAMMEPDPELPQPPAAAPFERE
jgi:hypothetical protein